jgi:alkylation response protein AidB-like acyl-CoA dehydrogenase
MKRVLFEDEHLMFRDSVRRFIEREVKPYHDQWEKDGIVPRQLWLKAGEQGYLCMDVPEEYGGGGVKDFRYATIITEEFTRSNCTGPGFSLHNDVAAPYILQYGDDAQKRRWFPQLASGEKILAIAMTEPGGGSDLANMQTRAIPFVHIAANVGSPPKPAAGTGSANGPKPPLDHQPGNDGS